MPAAQQTARANASWHIDLQEFLLSGHRATNRRALQLFQPGETRRDKRNRVEYLQDKTLVKAHYFSSLEPGK